MRILTKDQIQGWLLSVSALFLFLYSIILTLSPAVREGSWQVTYRLDHWVGFFLWLILFGFVRRELKIRLPERDPYLLPIAALLSGWGLLTIWRLSPYFGMRQAAWFLVAIGIFNIGLRLPEDLTFLQRYKYIWLSGGLLLTTLTLIFGTNPVGMGLPRLWLGCCGVYFQPSEPLKLLLIVYLAGYLAGFPMFSKKENLTSTRKMSLFSQLIPTIFMSGLALLLLLVQRDLGTATIFLFLYAIITYVATGVIWIPLISTVVLVLAGLSGYWLFDVVRLRFDAWINPWLDPAGRSYQIVQSLLALANGGIFGRGPGLGSPTLVPVAHSDFIFSAIVEETGLLGAIGLLILLALFTARSLIAAFRSSNPFRRFLAVGLAAYLVGQSLLIIAGNIRLLPLTGVTLPFVSYGGTSLVTSFLSLLFLLIISNQREIQPIRFQPVKPYLQFGGLFFMGIIASALTVGWWSYYRGQDLLTRTDNTRRIIADRHVKRGSIFDRDGRLIAHTIGEPGDYSRQIEYPQLSSIIGYTNPIYGQSGIEAAMDDYLRGLRGYPTLTIWWNHLQYGRPPAGRDIRTSLELDLQQVADELLADNIGSVVLLNAETGEILVMASHPTFDANQLVQQWQALTSDPNAPLLNRAVLGNYPIDGLVQSLFERELSELNFEFKHPTGFFVEPSTETDPNKLVASPLFIVELAALLSNNGINQPPVMVTSVNIDQTGWEILPIVDKAEVVISSDQADQAAIKLEIENYQIWQTVKIIPGESTPSYTWFVGGTLPNWDGKPYAAVVLLEAADKDLATLIGNKVLHAAMGYRQN